jgi:hypothetical protein
VPESRRYQIGTPRSSTIKRYGARPGMGAGNPAGSRRMGALRRHALRLHRTEIRGEDGHLVDAVVDRNADALVHGERHVQRAGIRREHRAVDRAVLENRTRVGRRDRRRRVDEGRFGHAVVEDVRIERRREIALRKGKRETVRTATVRSRGGAGQQEECVHGC